MEKEKNIEMTFETESTQSMSAQEKIEQQLEEQLKIKESQEVKQAKRRALIEVITNMYKKYYTLKLKSKEYDLYNSEYLNEEIEKVSSSTEKMLQKIKSQEKRKPYSFVTVGLPEIIDFPEFWLRWKKINVKLNKFLKKVDLEVWKTEFCGKEEEVKVCWTIEQRSEEVTWGQKELDGMDITTGYIKGAHLHILFKTPDLKKSKLIKDYVKWWSKNLEVPEHMVDIRFLKGEEDMKRVMKYMNYGKVEEEKKGKVEIDKKLHSEVLQFHPAVEGRLLKDEVHLWTEFPGGSVEQA